MKTKGWLPALRIARREAKRAKRRSLLVLAMIALPVAFLSFAAVTFDMFELSPQERLDRRLGAADARLTWVSDSPITQSTGGDEWGSISKAERPMPATEAELLALLPPGSRMTPIAETDVRIRDREEIGAVSAKIVDVGDPLTQGIVATVEGKAPSKPGEVAVNAAAARELGIGIGDTIRVAKPNKTFTVTGIVEFPDQLSRAIAFLPSDPDAPTDRFYGPTEWLAQVPEGLDWKDVTRLNTLGILALSRTVVTNPPADQGVINVDPASGMGEGLAIGLLVAGLGTLEIVLLAGPAFAVGARRRSRDLALIAAAGGDPKQLRRIVLADGVVLGTAGAITGIAVGVLLGVAGRSLVEEHLVLARAGGWRFFPLALIVIAIFAVGTGLLAAMVPAFTAARQDVVQVLSGRRGVIRYRKRWITLGAFMLALGSGIAVWGGLLVTETLILLGIIVAELGLVLLTPALIGFVARFGRWLPLAPRLALRDTARNRSAAAPAISAVMAAVAGAVAVGVFLTGNEKQQLSSYTPSVPPGHVALQHFQRPGEEAPDWSQLEAGMREVLPSAQIFPYRVPGCGAQGFEMICDLALIMPESQKCPYTDRKQAMADSRCAMMGRYYGSSGMIFGTVVDDGQSLGAFIEADPAEMAKAREVLAAGGAVVTDPRYLDNGRVTLATITGDKVSPELLPQVTVPGYVLRSESPAIQAIVSTGALAQTGLEPAIRGLIADTDAMPTLLQEKQLNQLLFEASTDAFVTLERGPTATRDPMGLILALAAAAIALGAAGIATGLAAADRHADLGTLAAVGAAPGVRRLLSLSQAGIISGLGALLGMIAGLGGSGVMILALNQLAMSQWPESAPPIPFAIPWESLAIIVAVPLVAMAAAGLLTRAWLPIERRF